MKDYKKILEGVMNIINTTENSDIGFVNICNHISENCPELTESEDEKIRKAILSGLKYLETELGWDAVGNIDILDAYAWLEKQCEKESDPRYRYLEDLLTADDIYQMSVNEAMVEEAKSKAINALRKLEIGKLLGIEKQGKQRTTDVGPKFHEGDWVVINGLVLKILKIQGDLCEILFQQDELRVFDTSVIDNEAHLWSIEDAKDGDVLAWDDSQCIALFKNIYDEVSFNSHGFVGHCTGAFESGLSYHDIEGARPATKEQRDILFLKMRESGYEWDAENKKLNKIEPKFKVGDWISDYMRDVHIASIKNGMYYFDEGNGLSIVFVDEHYHLWDIEEAMNGDVLVCDGKHGQEIGIVKKYIGKYGGCDMCFVTYCYVDWEGIFRVGEYMGSRHIHPATKEQRDLLFHKMKEAGYEFDFKKEELKKFK